MRILSLFCHKFEYFLDHPTKVAIEVSPDQESGSFTNALAVFLCVEAGDTEGDASACAAGILEIANKNDAQTIVVNPFAHLSKTIADPKAAIALSNVVFEKVNELAPERVVHLCPFGWYKSFLINAYGEDNSQTFRQYSDGGVISTDSGAVDRFAVDPFNEITRLLSFTKVEYKVSEHEPTQSSAESAEVRGVALDTGTKALLIKYADNFVVAVIPADKQLEFRLLREFLGAKKLRLATEEELLEQTGLPKGALPPFGRFWNLLTVYDSGILEKDLVRFNAGRRTHSIEMKARDLVSLGADAVTSLVPDDI